MLFLQRRPAPPLDTAIESIWIYDDPDRAPGLERVLPTGAAQLIVNLAEDVTRVYDDNLTCIEQPGAILSGASSQHQTIDTDEQKLVAGVVFRPGGTRAFMPAPAHEIADLDVPLDDLWGRRLGTALRDRLLEVEGIEPRLAVMERFLHERWKPRPTHRAVALAVDLFHRRPELITVSRVTDLTGLSAKRFIEHFKREIGLTPKRYCRVLRFQSAVRRAAREDIDWTRVAADGGYFDQSHFIHDFRAFAGLTPSEYERSRTIFPNHLRLPE